MAAVRLPAREEKGLGRLRWGAGFGVAAALVGLAGPSLLLALSSYDPGGYFSALSAVAGYASWTLIAASVLFLVSLMGYRWAFSALRGADGRFTSAYVLCTIGSMGFLVLIVAGSLLLGSGGALESCAHSAATKALGCFESLTPFGRYTALIGFWLGWVGSVGIVAGLAIAAGRFGSGFLAAGSVAYAVVLVLLALPFVNEIGEVPGLGYLLKAGTALAVAAPLLVAAGAGRSRPVGPAPAAPQTAA